MKAHPALTLALSILGASTALAESVTGWTRTNGDLNFTGGSEATDSPVTDNADADTIAGTFTPVTLAVDEFLQLTGSVTITRGAGGTLGANQFRWGLFEAPLPLVTGNGTGGGFVGAWAGNPTASVGSLRTCDGSTTNPFSSSASTIIGSAADADGYTMGDTMTFTLTIARLNATEIAVSGSLTDGAALDVAWSDATTAASPASFTYNAVAFLMGGSTNGDDATYSAVEVTVGTLDSDNDGMRDTWELANGLNVGVDDSGVDEEPDGLTNLQEYQGADGIPFTGDETDPQDPDTDGDGLNDGPELTAGTDPLVQDSDGDFFLDGYEVAQGTLPLDDTSYPLPTAGYFIDFSNNGSAGQDGPRHNVDYLPFVADHEVDSTNVLPGELEVDRAVSHPVPAFTGSPTVTLAVAYPDPAAAAPTVKQMLGRTDALAGGGFATLYEGEDRDLMRDWIGIDGRAANGGNGEVSSTVMTFTLTGIPAGIYQYRGYHHDVANIQAPFDIAITDNTSTGAAIGSFRMTHGNDNGLSPLTNPGTGNTPDILPSTIEFLFTSNGTDPVVVTYSVIETAGTFQDSVFAVNAIEITTAVDSDGDGIPDGSDLRPGIDDTGLSSDADSLTDLEEFHLGTALDNPDTDGDGFNDDVETNTGTWVSLSDTGTSPWVADWDGDGLLDGVETNDLNFVDANVTGTDPFLVDTDGDGFNDGDEVTNGTDPTDAGDPPPPVLPLRIVSADPVTGDVTLEWDSDPTASYDIYASDDLMGDPQFDWDVVQFNFASEGTLTDVVDALGTPLPAKRFYIVYEFTP